MRKLRVVTAALCLSAFLLSAASAQAQSLYERLGGKDAIKAVVDEFVGIAAGDNRINKKFAKTDINRLKFALVEDLVKALDKFNVKEKEKNELLGLLGPMKPDIVEVKSKETGTALPAKFKPAPPLKEDKMKGDKGKKEEKKKKGY